MNANELMQKMANMPLREFLSQATGLRKESQEAITGLLQTRLYEKGFARRLYDIIPTQPVELGQAEDDDNPVIWKNKAVEAPAAATVPFGQEQLEMATYTGKRYPVRFYDIMSPKVIKAKTQLYTYPDSVGTFLKDNLLWQIENIEDYTMMSAFEKCLVAHPENIITMTGKKFDKEAFKIISQKLIAKNLPHDQYKLFCHHNLWLEILSTDAVEVGDQVAGEMFLKGVKYNSGEEKGAFGLNFVTHRKNEIPILRSNAEAPDGKYPIKKHSLYLLPPREFFGEFRSLHDIKVITEETDHNYTFHAWETLGLGIGNTASVFRVDFVEYEDKLEGDIV